MKKIIKKNKSFIQDDFTFANKKNTYSKDLNASGSGSGSDSAEEENKEDSQGSGQQSTEK